MFQQEGARGYSAIMYYTGVVFQRMCNYYDRPIQILWSKKSFIQTYEHMGVRTDGRDTEDVYFDRGVCKYVRVNAIMIFDQIFTLLIITIIDHILGLGSCE